MTTPVGYLFQGERLCVDCVRKTAHRVCPAVAARLSPGSDVEDVLDVWAHWLGVEPGGATPDSTTFPSAVSADTLHLGCTPNAGRGACGDRCAGCDAALGSCPNRSDRPNLEFSYGEVVHATSPVSSLPWGEPLCTARSRWQPVPSSNPVSCQACLRRLAAAEVTAGLVTDEKGQCPHCGDFVFTTTIGKIAGHQTSARTTWWCRGAGQDPYPAPHPKEMRMNGEDLNS
jgi:hypothetical protein